MDVLDWAILALVTAFWAAATVYLFRHPSEGAFATWAGACVTMTGAYHWLLIRDSKTKDADGP